MSKKPSASKSRKKAVQSSIAAAVITPAAAPEMSYDEMLSELEAIVSEANLRQAEEEVSL